MIELRKRIRGLAGDRRGFTLVELLVVLAILALVAALIVPSVMGNLDQSRVKADELAATQIYSAAQMYKIDVGEFPAAPGALVTNPGGAAQTLWRGPYLDIIPSPKQRGKTGWTINTTTGAVYAN
ncbi:MAG: prepilin-type N-terminal cleavage/methylation domain-containing protein [Clostridia bacterium]|nr:prepilin-type N-terminal cleavage/methylation domain-containing protein [Clostridia bacterium]